MRAGENYNRISASILGVQIWFIAVRPKLKNQHYSQTICAGVSCTVNARTLKHECFFRIVWIDRTLVFIF